MRTARRALLVGLLALAGALMVGDDPRDVEALTALRAKIKWKADGYLGSKGERTAEDTDSFVFWRSGLLTRQSNPDPAGGQVLTSTQFVDTVTFTSSLDLPRAAIKVQQPTFGTARSVHAKVSVYGLPAATELQLEPDATGEPAIKGETEIELTITSRVPVESQIKPLRGLTPRVFTSLIQVVERVGTGTAWRTLNKPMIVRTEFQASAWAVANGRPTPTAVGH
jgi:hypothetical protein